MTMLTRMALGLATVTTLIAFSGCDEDGFEHAGPTVDCIEPDVDELPFDRDSIEKLVAGRHRSTLAWRGPGASRLPEDEQSEEITLDVRKSGELRWGLYCGGTVRFPVDVEVAMSGGRRATFQGQVRGRKDGAQILTDADISVADALSIPGPSVVGEGQPSYLLNSWIDEDGVRGALRSQSDTAAECERARWPVERACENVSDREMPFDTTFGDFDFGDVMGQLDQLKSQEVRWVEEEGDEESTTNLQITFERGQAPVCVGIEYSDDAFASYRGRALQTTLTARVTTDDGRVDTEIPVTASVRWSNKRGVITVPGDGVSQVEHTLVISADVTRSGTQLFHPVAEQADDPDRFQSFSMSVTLGREAAQGDVYLGEIHVDATEPQIELSAAYEQMSLEGVCLEGASRRKDLARGTFGPLARRGS